MSLFKTGYFNLHSGDESTWKIDCDVLTDDDWRTLAGMATSNILPKFGSVEGVPNGGLKFAEALRPYITEGPVLIVDDVLTTGNSMIQQKGDREAIGIVVFSRSNTLPNWITAIFRISS